MDSKLKTFIDMNRQQLDAYAPSPALWQKIDAGMQQPAFIKSHTSWLKYFAYSASAITVAAGLSVLLRSEPATPSTPPPAATNTDTPGTPLQSTLHNDTIPGTPEKKAAVKDASPAETLPEPHTNTAEAVLPYTPALPEAPVAPEQPKAPVTAVNYSAGRTAYRDKHSDSLNVDTSFAGITHFELIVSSADVNVKPSGTASVQLKARMFLKEHGPVIGESKLGVEYERKDSIMTVRITNRSARHLMISGSTSIQATVDLAIPDGITLGINDRYGDVSINGISTKKYAVASSSGDVEIKNTRGPLKLSSSYGAVSFENLKGDIDVHAGSGDLAIAGLDGNALIGASYGNITLKDIAGQAKISTTSGDVKISKMTGSLEVVSSYGNIRLDGYKGTPRLSATSGDITGKNVELLEGMVTQCTYGDIDMQLLNSFADLSFDLSSRYGTISVPGTETSENPATLQVTKGKILVKGVTTSGDQRYR